MPAPPARRARSRPYSGASTSDRAWRRRAGGSGHRVEDRGDVLDGGARVQDADPGHDLAVELGRCDQGEAVLEVAGAPGAVVVARPADPADAEHREIGLVRELQVVAPLDLGASL